MKRYCFPHSMAEIQMPQSNGSYIDKYIYSVLFGFLFSLNVEAQDTAFIPVKASGISDTSFSTLTVTDTSYRAPYYPYNKNKVKLVAAGNIIGYSTIMAGLYATWYKDYPQSSFHAFNDLAEWKQMDKAGHIYTAYAAGKASMELWRWTGLERKKRIWIGGMSGAVYLTLIETLDGFSSQWGWSWGDFGANVLGSSAFVAQELAWDEQRIQMKWSFHRKHYHDPLLNMRSDDVFGKTTAERFLKDYNGQTYWLSTTINSFVPSARVPAWLQISMGTGVEGLFGARENIGKDKNGTVIFSRTDIKRYRQWFLAPDVDLTKIKTNKKGIKLALMILNIFKFPTPSMELSNGKLKWNWIHF